MDTKPLEKFCPWARVKLLDAIHARCVLNGLDDAGRAAAGLGAEVIGTHVLKPYERQQRDNLFKRIEAVGYNAFVDEEAYTWFNRFMGIRYMEVHGYLPSGIRVLSDTDGSFDPACLRAAGELDLPGLDRDQAIDLAIAGNRTELFRLILIAQCNQLADALPSVFDHVDDADALVLPDGLLNKDENSVLYHLVEDIPEETWQDVEIMGWMYQFYNAELKAEFFKSKRKAAPEDLAPATQLFTPEWIVRYMVDNSLGRLWMLNHPDSRLIERAQAENPTDRLMEYYIQPDEEHEDFIRIASPEDITFCDPACGSGHILVYAFKMLMAIYEECGYRTRDIPELILTKNLSGMEIDPRAAQIATLALAMCAREHDRRFFSRDVVASIRVLRDVTIDADSLVLTSPLRERPELLDTLAHLGEIGSLFAPTDDDIAALEGDLHESPVGDLFSARANENVDIALSLCKALQKRFDVVVANPPYMGIRQLNGWYANWLRSNYKNAKYDVYAAFISRMRALAKPAGILSFVSMHTWTTDVSAQKLRDTILRNDQLLSMIVMEAGVMPIAFQTSATVLCVNAQEIEIMSSFISIRRAHLSNDKSLTKQRFDTAPALRRRQSMFLAIPMEIIAYWISPSMLAPLTSNKLLSNLIKPRVGIQTGDTERFTRLWWEISERRSNIFEDFSPPSNKKWIKYRSGGDFRKWYGNEFLLIDWLNNGENVIGRASIEKRKVMNLPDEYRYMPLVCWSDYGMGAISFRYGGSGFLFDVIEPAFVARSPNEMDSLPLIIAYGNSSVASVYVQLLMPGRHKNVGKVAILPLLPPEDDQPIKQIANNSILLSKTDWESQELSWNFKRNPLV